MANDFQGQWTAAANVNFQQRVAAGLRSAAVAVYTENPTTPNHATRAAYVIKIVNTPPLEMITINQFGITGPDALTFAWATLLAAQGFDNNSTDAAISTQMATDWNAMSGV